MERVEFLKLGAFCIQRMSLKAQKVLLALAEKTVLGEVFYPVITSIPEDVDVVDIFRRSEEVPPIVREAIKKGCKAVWMQKGVINDEAAAEAREADLKVVMNKCMFKEHMRLLGSH